MPQVSFALVAISNVDVTPLFCDMVDTRTVEVKKENIISVKSSGSDKPHFSTILTQKIKSLQFIIGSMIAYRI